jgi:hypothetical protein
MFGVCDHRETKGCVMTTLKDIRKTLLAVIVALGCATTTVQAQDGWSETEGGLKDLSTGLVWGPSITSLYDTWTTWSWAKSKAADFAVGEYDDWRLPSRSEMLTAIDNGTLTMILLYYPGIWNYDPDAAKRDLVFWTSDRRGNKAYVVFVRVEYGVAKSGRVELWAQGSGCDALMVRP